MNAETRVVIPVKRLEESKTSFSDIFSEEQRRKLTLSMLEDILKVARQVDEIETIVVTPDENVMDFVKDLGFKTISEPDIGLNRALELAIGDSIDSDFTQVLIIPADVPLISSEDIVNILELAPQDKGIVITPSEEKGTNALLLHPPDVIDLNFGGESFPEHVKAAKSRVAEIRLFRSENLERDIDEPPDLIKVETLGKGTNTHAFLNSLK